MSHACTKTRFVYAIHALDTALATHPVMTPAFHSPTETPVLTLFVLEIDCLASSAETSRISVILSAIAAPGNPPLIILFAEQVAKSERNHPRTPTKGAQVGKYLT